MNAERRSYRSPLREEQAAGTRARIVDACLALVHSGGDLTYEAVAAAAGVQERTVYRHFPRKSDLESAVWSWIVDNLTKADFAARSVAELEVAVRRSFEGFDAGAPLIQAMLHTRQGLAVRVAQQPGRREMFEATATTIALEASREEVATIAAALQVLYSATAWELLRTFWQLNAAGAADVVTFAIEALSAGAPIVIERRAEGRAPPASSSDS